MIEMVASREGDFRRLATTTANLALGSFIFNTYLPPVFFGLPAGRSYIGVFGVGIVTIWGGGSTDSRPGRPVPGGVEWSHCNLITESNETLGLKIWALGGDPWTEKVNTETQQVEIFDVKDSQRGFLEGGHLKKR